MDNKSLIKSLQLLSMSIASTYLTCLLVWEFLLGKNTSVINILSSPVFFLALILSLLSYMLQGFGKGGAHANKALIVGFLGSSVWIVSFFIIQFK